MQIALLVEWSETATDVTVEDFTSNVGPTAYIPSNLCECLGLFYNDNIIDPIVRD